MNPFVIALSALLLVGSSCSKKSGDSSEDLFQQSPASKVPDQLATGTWFSGTLSAISYFDRDGHRLGNEYEAGREYTFSNVNGKGRIKFWQYLGVRTASTCVTEHYTYKEGTVVFEGDKFTIYPVKGNFKTIKDKCSSGNGTTKRDAAGDDLKPDVYRWEIKTIDGKTYFYTYLDTDVDHEDPVFVYSWVQ
ncbi:hypothetical protein [Paraflavitalea sp. CAU 1676]|uniref:hypothetical protein n=1 Tax=Paraflavitalea sp. CAU 1676 TaxID=3032598 RepID=UPI0023D9B790|nr:hypothetical protein [Paraflavitalea sp. CAU 1676]MDF2193290.1 hypothetical protein [Paraflavitalea sp. CAU 1676]